MLSYGYLDGVFIIKVGKQYCNWSLKYILTSTLQHITQQILKSESGMQLHSSVILVRHYSR